jgi:hypothetical protein
MLIHGEWQTRRKMGWQLSADGLMVEWKTYVVVLLTVLREESGGGSHC